MEKQERSHNSSHDSTGRQQSTSDAMIGKIDMSRSITEDLGEGEGDRLDTIEMEKLARDDSR